ncbi:MAG: response regulator transcription factor [Gammaproteobacteria bacterium]|nr:response regulator transcription factor [Gammaproteobacteria bacterium]
MNAIRVLLADDHSLFRAGIQALLMQIDGVQVVGEADTGRKALEMARAHTPDVVLMDIAMPEMNGLDTAARLTKEFPGVRVIMLSMHAGEEYVMQALRAGASGYLLKDAATSELELAVRAVARGETYLTPTISKRVIDDYLMRTTGTSNSTDQLTKRQREILQLIAKGYTSKEMAQMLNLSPKTIETHRTQLMKQLDIHDVAGLVRYAIRVGLVTLDA